LIKINARPFSLKEYSYLSAAFLLLNEKAESQVIYTDIEPDIELQLNGQTAGVDLDNNGDFDFAFLKVSGSFTTFWVSSTITLLQRAIWAGAYGTSANAIAGSYTQQSEAGGVYILPYALASGKLIYENLSFQNDGFQIMGLEIRHTNGAFLGAKGNWYPDVEDRYLGVRFIDQDDCFHYGWIRCTTTDTTQKLIIKDYAYETECDKPIIAGDTVSYDDIHENLNTLNATVYGFGNNVYISLYEDENVKVSVYDLSGELIFTEMLIDKFSFITLHQPPGLYIVYLTSENKSYSKKVYID